MCVFVHLQILKFFFVLDGARGSGKIIVEDGEK